MGLYVWIFKIYELPNTVCILLQLTLFLSISFYYLSMFLHRNPVHLLECFCVFHSICLSIQFLIDGCLNCFHSFLQWTSFYAPRMHVPIPLRQCLSIFLRIQPPFKGQSHVHEAFLQVSNPRQSLRSTYFIQKDFIFLKIYELHGYLFPFLP